MVKILPLDEVADATKFGGKAANLGKLLRADLPVPAGFAVPIQAFDARGRLLAEHTKEVKAWLSAGKLYAVRSSATVEDADEASWAGQFESYLNVEPAGLVQYIERCHNSAKARTKAYAKQQSINKELTSQVAVVVQEMVPATFAGVMFTKDPSNGSNKTIIEYVPGLGESLVHGDADPERIAWNRTKRAITEQTEQNVPIPSQQLIKLAEKIERSFGGVPQDIEWAFSGSEVWIVQSRPITTLQERGTGKHYLGNPDKLFYWGPSRALPLYMSDFLLAEQENYDRMVDNPKLVNPPKTIVIFINGQMVWLNKAAEFGKFVRSSFKEYEQGRSLEIDRTNWNAAVQELDDYMTANKYIKYTKLRELLINAWRPTLPAEFALYGAESVLEERMHELEPADRLTVWGAMTLDDEPTFMQRIDIELATSKSPGAAARQYPWIQDGYSGVFENAGKYFTERLKIIAGSTKLSSGSPDKRQAIIKKYGLNDKQVAGLSLARGLAEFMDDRKAWMMRTRRYIKRAASQFAHEKGVGIKAVERLTLDDLVTGTTEPYHGWSYLNGLHQSFNAQDAALAWDWYVEFKASKSVLAGIVVSSGGRHFINGKVFVAESPQSPMPDEAILVVPSTSPSYVPLMRKARALVTDHGGMMSHAAIVAREFGLPCIVGTKRATKILHNGDKVVLDLVKGEVNR
ncbi:MAG TPA: PEP/pyruvate-binding domain-containing protein [Candidatus Limnocylindrales bacterium]|nr:PEP/pyruvate-binding domain-containing protein [Candidatus Limnocylindrales bacterium]